MVKILLEPNINRSSFYILLMLLLSGCDVLFGCFITNKTTDTMYVKLKPPKNNINYIDSIGNISPSKTINVIDSLAVYKVSSKESLVIYSNFGSVPSEELFPFTYMEIIKNSNQDTLILSSKKSILAALKRYKRTRKYTITVDK